MSRSERGPDGRQTKEAKAWKAMIERCYLPTNASYHRYGGRGITVCERWLSDYRNFLSDMGRSPAGHSLDRVDPNGNYEPGNCRWATPIQQSQNRCNTPMVEYQGAFMPLIEAARASGLKYVTLWQRYSKGWRDNRLFDAPTLSRPYNERQWKEGKPPDRRAPYRKP